MKSLTKVPLKYIVTKLETICGLGAFFARLWLIKQKDFTYCCLESVAKLEHHFKMLLSVSLICALHVMLTVIYTENKFELR